MHDEPEKKPRRKYETLEPTGFTIPQCAEILECTPQYVRYLIRHKKLRATREKVYPLSDITRHEVSPDALAEYQASLHTHSRREDKRNKFIFYAGPKEYDEVVELVRTKFPDVAATMVPANTVKSMGFQRTIYGGQFVNKDKPPEDE